MVTRIIAMKNIKLLLTCLIVSLACVTPCWALHADMNYDDVVNLPDLAILANEWLETGQQEYLPMMVGSSRVRVSVPNEVNFSGKLEACYLDKTSLWESYSWETGNTITLDTVNYQCSRGADASGNFGSVKFTSGSYVSPLHMRTISFEPNYADISGEKCMKLRYFVYDTGLENQNKFCGLSIFLKDYTNKYSWYCITDSFYGRKPPILAPGWHTASFILKNPSCQQSGFDFTKLRFIEMQIVLKDAAQQYTSADGLMITFDLLKFFTPISTAQYALTFDDGYADEYNIAAYLTAKGLRATFYVIPSRIDTPGYLTLEQLKVMHANGHLIANHTWSHKHFINDNLTIPQYIEEVIRASEWLYANGFGDGARILAQPAGTGCITEEGINAVLGKYVDQIRFTVVPSTGNCDNICVYIDYDPHLLYASGTTGADADAALAAAIADNSLRIFYTHSLSGGAVRAALLAHIDAVAEAVENGEVEVVTMDELLEPSRY